MRREIGALLQAELAGSPRFSATVAGALEAQRKGSALEGARWLLLTLSACEGAGGDWRNAVPAAAAIELFITAGDLLDDIEDGDIPAAEVPHSANVACALLLLSGKAALRLKEGARAAAVLAAISGAGVRSCVGQHLDLTFETRDTVTEQAWLEMTDLRSGSLLECACRVGVIAGGGDEQQIDTYGRFGHLLGIAGQISNDLHILNSPSGRSDIARRKKTFPLMYALNNVEGRDRDTLLACCGAQSASTNDEVRRILERLGAFYYSTFVAEEYRLKAFQVLRDAGVAARTISRFETATTVRG